MTLNFAGKLLDLTHPVVMGVVNLNEDSFHSASRAHNLSELLHMVEKHLVEGAHIIDIGYMSSRPGALISDPLIEAPWVKTATSAILQNFPATLISVDTIHSQVAKSALDAGALMINDISAGTFDQAMMNTVASFKVPYCIMHMKGTPDTMQNDTEYKDIVLDVCYYLEAQRQNAINTGILDIVIDPGFGFGKNISQNYELLSKLNFFTTIDATLLVGISRKSMIYKLLNVGPEEALNGTTALHMIALSNGAKILRVHDVKEAMECVQLHKMLNYY